MLTSPALAHCLLEADCFISEDVDEVEIIIRPNQEGEEPPRSPDITTIEAWFSWTTSSVRVSLSNAGDFVQVEFKNRSSGERYSFVINGNSSSVLPISNSSGYWAVSFTLSSGASYYGCFLQ